MAIWKRAGDTKYSSPIPNSLERRKKKTQGMHRAHGKDGRAAGAGAGTETSALQCSEHVHSLLLSSLPLPSMDSFPNAGGRWAPLEGNGLTPGSWAHVPCGLALPSPEQGAASSPSQWDSDKWTTATWSVLQEVDKAGREDSGAGAIALNEADLGVQKRGLSAVRVLSQYISPKTSPLLNSNRDLERRSCGDTSVEPSQPSSMHTWGRSPPSMPPPKYPVSFRIELEGEKNQDLDPSTCPCHGDSPRSAHPPPASPR